MDYRRTEYEMGITLLVPGIDLDRQDKVTDAEVAIVLLARVDGAGREQGGTPVVVEHRTGESASETSYESDLYALATAWAVKDNRAAVHVHHLGLQDGPVCERRFYDEAALTEAAERLRAAAGRIAAWHPNNATAPTYEVGNWCTWCPVRERCERHR
ncbi:MAG: PD-(D/E)XK nuclease family protein [Acidimicrobiia bacterium]|nr:PD-(D/E)XK nuclease family protein [Acidimicrobiia bacterium]